MRHRTHMMSAIDKESSLGEMEALIVPAGVMQPFTTGFDPNGSSPLPHSKYVTRTPVGSWPLQPRAQLVDKEAAIDVGFGKIDTAHDDTITHQPTTPEQLLAWADNILAEVSATSWGKKAQHKVTSRRPRGCQNNSISSKEGEAAGSSDSLLSRLWRLEMMDGAAADVKQPPRLETSHVPARLTGASWEGHRGQGIAGRHSLSLSQAPSHNSLQQKVAFTSAGPAVLVVS
mgnify:CR=1 FL=1